MKPTFVFILLFVYFQSYSIIAQATEKQPITKFERIIFKIDSLLTANQTLLRYSNYGIAVYSLNHDQMIYSQNLDNPLKPASTTKLVTSFVTYSLVGDTFRIRTQFYTNDRDISDKVINGNLYIRGMGDCSQKLEDLDEIVRQLKSLGIKRITGDIVADGTFFDDNNNRFLYSGDYDEVEPTALITALSLENNRIRIIVNTQSSKPKIQIIPYSPSINVTLNNIGGQTVTKKVANRKKPIKLSSGRTKIFSKLDENGYQRITISAKLKGRSTMYFEEFNLNPVLSYAGAVYNRLINNGVSVDGTFLSLSQNQAPNYTQLNFVGEISKPINILINEMNKNSNNYYAETLFKFNSAYSQKDKNLVKASKILTDSLLNTFIINYKPEFAVLNDGSGLSRRNRLTANILIQLMKQASKSNYFSSFLSSLAVAGKDGTLEKRMRGTYAEQKVFAKTGTHRDVSALSGYIYNTEGEVFLFALLFNGGNVGSYKILENQLCEIIASS